jgi:hypothetical protein
MTLAPRYPLLTGLLWTASAAVYVRGACHLTVCAVVREKPLDRVYGWYAAASGLMSGTALSAGWWQAGAFFGVMSAVLGVLWVQERNDRKNPATVKECG